MTNKEAQELGYLLDIYHKELYPTKFDEKQKKPIAFEQKDDKSVVSIGKTDMKKARCVLFLNKEK